MRREFLSLSGNAGLAAGIAFRREDRKGPAAGPAQIAFELGHATLRFKH
jgi:hypothetical protein